MLLQWHPYSPFEGADIVVIVLPSFGTDRVVLVLPSFGTDTVVLVLPRFGTDTVVWGLPISRASISSRPSKDVIPDLLGAHTMNYGPFIKIQLASRNQLEGLMWRKFGHVNP